MRTPPVVNVLIVILTAGVLAGCEAGAPPARSPNSGALTTPRGVPTESTPRALRSDATAAALAPTIPPTTDPTLEPLVLSGRWVNPRAGATLTSYKTTLSAKPSATGDGVTTFTSIVFSATWAGANATVACKATAPDKTGAWSCQANLLALGVPPGKVTLSFDVVGVAVPVARTPDGPRQITYAVKPPRPTNTHLEQLEQPDYENGDNSAILHRVRWSAPAGYADEFLLYETLECPRPATKENSGKPCFVAGTPVDTSKLESRAKAPGDARSVEVRLTEYECGPAHGTILLRARNAYGRSVFAIVEAAPVIWVAPGDTIC